LALLEGKLSTGKITLFLYVRINHAKDQLNVTEAMKQIKIKLQNTIKVNRKLLTLGLKVLLLSRPVYC
jgi:hypothetical protein